MCKEIREDAWQAGAMKREDEIGEGLRDSQRRE